MDLADPLGMLEYGQTCDFEPQRATTSRQDSITGVLIWGCMSNTSASNADLRQSAGRVWFRLRDFVQEFVDLDARREFLVELVCDTLPFEFHTITARRPERTSGGCSASLRLLKDKAVFVCFGSVFKYNIHVATDLRTDP
jgi:hypothetical protein